MTNTSEPRRSGVPRHESDPPARAVFLVGFMGSGKSSVGQALSRRLGWLFMDLDHEIERRELCSIAEIFRHRGEAAFRQVETESLRELLEQAASSPLVAALGGGTVVQPQNLDLLNQTGAAVVFLDAPLDVLWERCTGEEHVRPLAQDKNQFRQLYGARRASYMKAGIRIDTAGRTVDTVAEEVVFRLGLDHYLKEK